MAQSKQNNSLWLIIKLSSFEQFCLSTLNLFQYLNWQGFVANSWSFALKKSITCLNGDKYIISQKQRKLFLFAFVLNTLGNSVNTFVYEENWSQNHEDKYPLVYTQMDL